MTLTDRQNELLAKGRFAELLGYALEETSDIALATEAAEIAFQEENQKPVETDVETIDLAGTGGGTFNQPGDFAPEPKQTPSPRTKGSKSRSKGRHKGHHRKLPKGLRLKIKFKKMSKSQKFATEDWVHYAGARGGKGWQNRRTGDVMYQDERPELRGEAQPQPGPQQQPRQQQQQPKQSPKQEPKQEPPPLQQPKQEPPQQTPQADVQPAHRQKALALHTKAGNYRGAVQVWSTMPDDEKDANWKALSPDQRAVILQGQQWAQEQQKVSQWFDTHLEASGLHPAIQAEYKANAEKVYSRWNRGTLMRFQANVQRGAHFHKDNQALNDDVVTKYPDDPIAERIRRGENTVGGYFTSYTDGTGELNLDGSWKSWAGKWDHEVYAHEFTHALDGPGWDISKTSQWQTAWRMEIKDKGVSGYAWSKPSEGFAEFGRLLYTTDNPNELWQKYPTCMSIFLQQGLHDYARPGTKRTV